MRPLFTLALLALASGTASAGGFRLFFDDGWTDEYDSRRAHFKRSSCRELDDVANFSLDKRAIARLKEKVRQVRFFDLPKRLNRNSDGETIMVCGPCPDSRLTIELGFRSRTIEWNCDCDNYDDPKELAPLLKELRDILYAAPQIAKLPRSSCAFY